MACLVTAPTSIEAKPRSRVRFASLLFLACIFAACAEQTDGQSASRWTEFVQVAGQPEPVPAEWVATPEGQFAHSIKIPHPVPRDSSYRKGMSSQEYFDHLCKAEAGEFIYKKVANVEGFYFMRPPRRPTDDDLKDRFKLEAPEIERTFQLMRASPQDRGKIFVGPPWRLYSFVEEPSPDSRERGLHFRVTGYKQDVSPMKGELVDKLQSRYGFVWRGVRRAHDRELAIAGSEWIVIDLESREVLAVQRNYARTGFNRNTAGGIWWLNALSCPPLRSQGNLSKRFYEFLTKSLEPASGGK